MLSFFCMKSNESQLHVATLLSDWYWFIRERSAFTEMPIIAFQLDKKLFFKDSIEDPTSICLPKIANYGTSIYV